MAYPKRYGRGEMNSHSGGKKMGDGYSRCAEDKSWSSGTGNVKESRLNAGGDKHWRGKRSKYAKGM